MGGSAPCDVPCILLAYMSFNFNKFYSNSSFNCSRLASGAFIWICLMISYIWHRISSGFYSELAWPKSSNIENYGKLAGHDWGSSCSGNMAELLKSMVKSHLCLLAATRYELSSCSNNCDISLLRFLCFNLSEDLNWLDTHVWFWLFQQSTFDFIFLR